MKYYVTIEDRTVEIVLSDTPVERVATIDGVEYTFDLAAVSGGAFFSLMVNNASHEIMVEDTEAGMEIIVGGQLFHIAVQDEWERRLATIQRRNTTDTGEIVVRAPMPGAVIAVTATIQARVARGEGLVILSAMKMENDIRAPRDGVITVVHVSPGDKVEHGAPLVTLGPA